METRVTYRTSEETVRRLQELSDKYGVSQSALLTLLVNERWLDERRAEQEEEKVQVRSDAPEAVREERTSTGLEGAMDVQPSASFPGNGQPMTGRKKRRRHRKK